MSQRPDDTGDADLDHCDLCGRDIDAHGTARFSRPDAETELDVCPEPMQLDAP